jgi:hypothetical protein
MTAIAEFHKYVSPVKTKVAPFSQFSLSLTLNGLIVAEQTISLPNLPTFKGFSEKEILEFEGEPLPLVGAIEPESNPILYPGNGLEIFYSMQGNASGKVTNSRVGTNCSGQFLVNYTQGI